MIALVYTMMALLTGPLPWVWVHHDDLPEDRADYYAEDGLPVDESADEYNADAPSENESMDDEETAHPDDAGHGDPVSQNDTVQADGAGDDPEEDSDGESTESSRSVLSWVSWSDRWSTADFVNCKLAWSDGTVLAEGYPAVFGEFYTCALHLGYHTIPEYDSWKEQFQSAIPGLPEDPLYDPADTSEPLVGVSLRTIEHMEVPPDQKVDWLGFSHDDPPIPGCDDGWMPAGEMCWRGPHTVKEDEVLGDELKLIGESHVHVLDTTPASEMPFLDPGCPQEHMLSLEMTRKPLDGEL